MERVKVKIVPTDKEPVKRRTLVIYRLDNVNLPLEYAEIRSLSGFLNYTSNSLSKSEYLKIKEFFSKYGHLVGDEVTFILTKKETIVPLTVKDYHYVTIMN